MIQTPLITQVTELIFDKLESFLNAAGWNAGSLELRLAGHSLGAQLVMNLGAKIVDDSAYSNQLKRVALLDHFFSNWGKDWGQLNGRWTGEYAREVNLPKIRDNGAVIENYRTSLTSSNPFAGDANNGLNQRTVFSELKPYYYSTFQFGEKHNAAFAIYASCMRFVNQGQLNNGAPSCRMSTNALKNLCDSDFPDRRCRKQFVQRDENSAYSTWDYDDNFDSSDVCTWYWWWGWWC